MNMLTLALVLVLASSQPQQRVISGTTVSLSSGPRITWQVAIEIRIPPSSLSLCGGSIVASKYIITAGHCLKSLSTGSIQDPAAIIVKSGISRSNPTQSMNVARMWVHPSYDASVSAQNRIDLGMIELVQPFTTGFGNTVTTINMCSGSVCGATGSPLIVSGYGQTVSDVSTSVAVALQQAAQLAVDPLLCAAKFASNFGCTSCLPATNVCAQSDNSLSPAKDSCFGDSGGPLVQVFNPGPSQTYLLYGVVSSGTVPASRSPSCGVVGEYGLYVSVAQNRAWIDNIVAGNANSTAITSACVAQGTCTAFAPSSNPWYFLSSWPFWAWIIIGVGAFLIFLTIMLCCFACRK